MSALYSSRDVMSKGKGRTRTYIQRPLKIRPQRLLRILRTILIIGVDPRIINQNIYAPFLTLDSLDKSINVRFIRDVELRIADFGVGWRGRVSQILPFAGSGVEDKGFGERRVFSRGDERANTRADSTVLSIRLVLEVGEVSGENNVQLPSR